VKAQHVHFWFACAGEIRASWNAGADLAEKYVLASSLNLTSHWLYLKSWNRFLQRHGRRLGNAVAVKLEL
jgi:hypothetical protein